MKPGRAIYHLSILLLIISYLLLIYIWFQKCSGNVRAFKRKSCEKFNQPKYVRRFWVLFIRKTFFDMSEIVDFSLIKKYYSFIAKSRQKENVN